MAGPTASTQARIAEQPTKKSAEPTELYLDNATFNELENRVNESKGQSTKAIADLILPRSGQVGRSVPEGATCRASRIPGLEDVGFYSVSCDVPVPVKGSQIIRGSENAKQPEQMAHPEFGVYREEQPSKK